LGGTWGVTLPPQVDLLRCSDRDGDGFLLYPGDKATHFGKELRLEVIPFAGLKDLQGSRAPVFNQPRPVERVGKTGITRIRRMLAIEVFNAQIRRQNTRIPDFQTIVENADLNRLLQIDSPRPSQFLLVF
jgi:hypothetical protein